jgi:DNA modification methylase
MPRARPKERTSTTSVSSGNDLHVAKFALMATSALTPHPSNPRKHSRQQIQAIAKSIESFGFNAPLAIDRQHYIRAGHGRWEAANLLGLKEVPVVFLDHLTEVQATAYMLADNKLTDRSDWDDAKVAMILKELSEIAINFDIEVTGFELPEIDFRIQSLEDPTSTEKIDEFDFASEPAASTLGDVWILGPHQICCASALDAATYDKLVENERAAAAFTDPPYNVPIDGHVSGKGETIHREFPMGVGEMSEAEFTDFLSRTLTNIKNHLIPGALLYICMDWRHMAEMLAGGRVAECDLLNLCIWAKTNGGMGSLYRSRPELVFVFRNGKEAHINNVQLGRFGRNRTNVWNYPNVNVFSRTGSVHPTIKPIALVADAIRDSTKRHDIVLDPFLGSGTTVLAAERTNRRCYGHRTRPALR